MNIPLLAQGAQTPATHTAAIMPSNPSALQRIPDSISTMTISTPAPQESCSWLNECFSTLVNKIKDLFEWVKSFFGCSQKQENPTNNQLNNQAPTSNTQPVPAVTPPIAPIGGEPAHSVNQPAAPVDDRVAVAVVDQPAAPVDDRVAVAVVDQPDALAAPANPVFGEEVLWQANIFQVAWHGVQHRLQERIDVWHYQDLRWRLYEVFKILPEEVKLHITNRMEALKREANPGVELVNQWADRVIHHYAQLGNEVVPFATEEEMDLLNVNNPFGQVIENLMQEIGAPEGEQPPGTLTVLRALIRLTELSLFLDRNRIRELRVNIVGQFNRLPEDIQNRVKNKMVEKIRPRVPEVDRINDWAGRVIRGEVRIEGEDANVQSIEAHINITTSNSLFYDAINFEVLMDQFHEGVRRRVQQM